jgi:threonine dehydrogenase-like Zn-dependent dehydrogenase
MRWNKLRYRELVTHLLPFEQAPGVYEQMLANSPDVLGVVFDWSKA